MIERKAVSISILTVLHKDLFDGPSYLVGNAISATNNLHEKMNAYNILLHLLIARFLDKIPKDQRLDFAAILELITKLYNIDCKIPDNEENIDQYKSFFPTSDAEMQNIYIVGKNSILRNLPRPRVRLIANHSYASLQ